MNILIILYEFMNIGCPNGQLHSWSLLEWHIA